MMKFFSLFSLLAVFLTAGPALGGTSYGKPVAIEEATPVSHILDAPDTYVGREVRVEGTVVEVCARRGCWMEIASDRAFEKFKIKVDDGVIVFPMTARGKKAVVQGRVEAINMNSQEAVSYLAHQAEERGEKFDPSSVTGPVTLYQLRATGALIE